MSSLFCFFPCVLFLVADWSYLVVYPVPNAQIALWRCLSVSNENRWFDKSESIQFWRWHNKCSLKTYNSHTHAHTNETYERMNETRTIIDTLSSQSCLKQMHLQQQQRLNRPLKKKLRIFYSRCALTHTNILYNFIVECQKLMSAAWSVCVCVAHTDTHTSIWKMSSIATTTKHTNYDTHKRPVSIRSRLNRHTHIVSV